MLHVYPFTGVGNETTTIDPNQPSFTPWSWDSTHFFRNTWLIEKMILNQSGALSAEEREMDLGYNQSIESIIHTKKDAH